MRRAVALILLAAPLACVAVGLFVILTTPEVMVQTVKYESSNEVPVMLVLLGLVFGVMSAFIVAMVLEDGR